MKEVGEGALTHLALKSTLPGSDHVLIRGERGPYVAPTWLVEPRKSSKSLEEERVVGQGRDGDAHLCDKVEIPGELRPFGPKRHWSTGLC